MKKILVPTDFSQQSNDIYRFARSIATIVDADLILLHVTPTSLEGMREKLVNPESLPKELNPRHPQVFQSYKDFSRTGPGSNTRYSFIIEHGFPVMGIKRAVSQYDIDMVIMGTRGERVEKFEGVYLGSVAGQIAEEVECPVLLVPALTSFGSIGEIVYGLDLNQYSLSSIQQVLNFTTKLNHKLHLVTVSNDISWAEGEMNKLKERLNQTQIKAKLFYKIIEHGHVMEGLNHYIEEVNASILVLERHQKNILEKVFSTSLVNQMTKHLSIPLLIMHVNE